ncbi:hypothetical protein ACIF9R_21260 [Streptomyces sp. NPDC086080]|uniref:hypothetical protein n=1 Tax=Streptomyces sp. NPDC086080 TaxID=3365748 RepID=UPI0037CD7920
MRSAQDGTTRSTAAAVPAGHTRWGLVALILGVPALLVFALLFTLMLWVLVG